MCIKGGKRCKIDVDKVNAHRRDRHAVRTAAILVNKITKEHGKDFAGDVAAAGLLINSPLIAKAYALAVKAHSGVRRTSGDAYINHPLRVAGRLQQRGFNAEVIAVGLLHDAVEDSPMTLGTLRKHGFSARVVSGVDSVTKRPGEKYEDTIVRATRHPIGRLVKLDDNFDNSSDEQLAVFPPEKQERQRNKYAPARISIITGINNVPAHELMTLGDGFYSDYQIEGSDSEIADIFKQNNHNLL